MRRFLLAPVGLSLILVLRLAGVAVSETVIMPSAIDASPSGSRLSGEIAGTMDVIDPQAYKDNDLQMRAGEFSTLEATDSDRLTGSDGSDFLFDFDSSPLSGAATKTRFAFAKSQPRAVAPFPLSFNQAVRHFVEFYLDHTDALISSFQRTAPYISQMTKLLNNRGVPSDFVYLAFAESAFSGRGAGPWQFSRTTARRLGLVINSYVDERRDPIKSTKAAAAYLATLHDQTGDWRLTVVGWNRGEAGLDRFIEQHGSDFNRILMRFPRATRLLVNRFMAVAFIARHAQTYGLSAVQFDAGEAFETVLVPGGTLIKRIAAMVGATVGEIRSLNPALLRDRVPPNVVRYEITVPRRGHARINVARHRG